MHPNNTLVLSSALPCTRLLVSSLMSSLFSCARLMILSSDQHPRSSASGMWQAEPRAAAFSLLTYVGEVSHISHLHRMQTVL